MSTEETRNSSPATQEAGALAREMAAAFRRAIEFSKKQYGLSPQEALAKVEEPPEPAYEENLRQMPVDQVDWHDLGHLTAGNSDWAAQAWESIKQGALDELQSGHRAALAVEGCYGSPWERARFLALRADLAAEWQPRNGIERQLIDAMAQAQTFVLVWMATLMTRITIETKNHKRQVDERPPWAPPLVSEAEAIEQASAMVDRFNRISLRTLRALLDLRRHAPTVIVQNAEQVNVGQQQVNVAKNQAARAARPARTTPASQEAIASRTQEPPAQNRAANGERNGHDIPERLAERLNRNGCPAAD